MEAAEDFKRPARTKQPVKKKNQPKETNFPGVKKNNGSSQQTTRNYIYGQTYQIAVITNRLKKRQTLLRGTGQLKEKDISSGKQLS